MNKIILYKAPWNFGGIRQPYFTSDSSRDNFLASLEKKEVNLDSDGVSANTNFKLDYNYEMSVKVNIDINEAELYNFAVITYNDRDVYCDIIDANHISIGYSRIELKRNVLVSRTNYLQYFKDFIINKATFSNLTYDKESKYFLPEYFRYTTTKEDLPIQIKAADTSGGTYVARDYINYYVVFFKTDGPLNAEEQAYLFGENLMYGLMLIPIINYNDHNMFAIRKPDGGYEICNGIGARSSDFLSFLETISPHIISLSYINIPCYRDTVSEIIGYDDGEPIILEGEAIIVPYFGSRLSTLEAEDGIGAFVVESSSRDNSIEIDKYIVGFFQNGEQYLLQSHEYRLFNSSNSIKVEPYLFSKGTAVWYQLDWHYIMNVNGTDIVCEVVPNYPESSIEAHNGDALKYIFPMMDNTHFIIDQAALFDAENRFYSALTRNSLSQRREAGIIQSKENLAVGASQLLFGGGQLMAGSGGMGQLSLGVGNVIRGFSEIAKTNNDLVHYDNERTLLAAQERSKPSSVSTGGSAAVRVFEQSGRVYRINEIPLQEDLNYFYAHLREYGIDCYIFRSSIDIKEFTFENEFFIKATASRNDLILNNREYSEMANILSAGIKYFII